MGIYFFFHARKGRGLPVVLIIKVVSGLRFLKLVLFPVPDSPTIAIVSAAIILMQN